MADLAQMPDDLRDYWLSYTNEDQAAAFLSLKPKTMRERRSAGTGPVYVALSSRCIRYRRMDLATWADSKARFSTKIKQSDPDAEPIDRRAS